MSDEDDFNEEAYTDNKVGKFAGLRFISFSKYVAQIGGENAKITKRLKLTDSAESTFFKEALSKWNEQDFSACYTSFVEEIPSDELETYAQLLHNKEIIVTTLIRYMNSKDLKFSIPAFCELLGALVKDLKNEFDDYMWASFDALTNILDFGEQHKESVEAAFYCLSTLVKVLWKKLIKNIKKTFSRFVPLFGSTRDYVRRFAAESFSFLMRKLGDLKDFTMFVINYVYKADDKYLKDGCANLFFNVYIGYSGSFHSAADQQITELITAAYNIEDFDERNYGLEIIIAMTERTVNYVRKHKTSLGVYASVILNILSSCDTIKKCHFMMCIIPNLYVEGTGGSMFKDVKLLYSIILKLVSSDFFDITETFVDFLVKTVYSILDQASWNISLRELFSILAKSKYLRSSPQLFLRLFDDASDLSAFDLHIMPSFGLCAAVIVENYHKLIPEVIRIYAKICSKRRPLDNVVNRNRSAFFDLSKHNEIKVLLLKQLGKLSELDENMVADIIVTWPWMFSSGEKLEGAEALQSFLFYLLEMNKSTMKHSQLCYIVGASLYQTKKELLADVPRDKLENLTKLCHCSQSSILLLMLHILSSGSNSDIPYLMRTADLLTPSFFCPSSAKRIASLEVLKSFKVPLANKINENEMKEYEGVFSILHKAESTELTDSRQRLFLFRKLIYGQHLQHMPKDCSMDLEHIILRIGLSQFFVQFTLLWPGMHELLSSFAYGMNIDKFWSVLGEILEHVNQYCHEEVSVQKEDKFSHLLGEMDVTNKSDYLSARVQILKFIAKISDLAERRTRILSPLLLDFYRKDFVGQTIEFENDIGNIKQLTATEKKKALCSFLEIFSKFSDANSTYLERQLREMYNNLLTFPNNDIIKSAMACILSYKYKAVVPYTEHFEALIDEKTFKEQLVLFKIDESDGDPILHSDHREVVLPILLRLLYGKLRLNTKKKLAASRRTAIFRYLGGCRKNELQLFLDILFEYVTVLIGNGEDMYMKMWELIKDANRSNRVCLDHLKSILINIIDVIKRISRSLVKEQQTQILRTLLSLGLFIRELLTASVGETKKFAKAKELRKLLNENFSEFFASFTTRTLVSNEIRQLLQVSLECYLQVGKNNAGQSIYIAPFSIVKLLANLCQLPSFWPILSVLVKLEELPTSVSLLEVLLSHLHWNGLTPEMLQIIRNAMVYLLTLSNESSSVEIDSIDHKAVTNQDVNYGTLLLVEHLPLVLQYLSESLDKDVKSKTISNENLEIISRLCDFIIDGEAGERMVHILVVQLERRILQSEILHKIILALSRLFKLVKNPVNYVSSIARISSTFNERADRATFLRVLDGIIQNPHTPTSLKNYLPLIFDLESWSERKLDEPDHERRHNAYNKLFEMWTNESLYDEAFLVFVISTHFFTLFTTNDMALRSTSASNLRALAEHIGRNGYNDLAKQRLLDKNLLSLLLKGFRNESEAVREECVRLLSTLVTSFPQHEHLTHFVQLQNIDEEQDFFTNLIHIQIHRRQRCISKLVNSIRDGKLNVPFEVLYRYLIPILNHYIISTASKTSGISDESLRLLNITMEIAPWSSYISTLEYWITKLNRDTENAKPIIRVVVAIIDAFHYDVASIEDKLSEDSSNSSSIFVRDKIMRNILPRLRKCIDGKSRTVHKKANIAEYNNYSNDDDIIKSPIALAAIKLLQKLPEGLQKQHTHGIILKLCDLLISRSHSVREAARKVTLQVCECLGPKYLPYIIKEMKSIMTKGYQVHVMIFTMQTFIFHMQPRLEIGNLDPCLDEILELCIKDQFDDTADEKEVGSIKAELPEAKGNKTPDTFLLLGKFIASTSLGIVLDKFKEELDKKTSSKAIARVSNLLAKFASGIRDNKGLTLEDQLVLIYQVINKNIEKMETLGRKSDLEESETFRPESCFILPKAPKRVGALVKTSTKSRLHVFVEFALHLLAHLITTKRFDKENMEDLARLDPFVPILSRCLILKYDKIVSHALRCIIGLVHMDIPSLQGQLYSLSERLFVLLSEYSTLGNPSNKHNLLQLNSLLFKAFTRIISIGNSSFLTSKNVSLLLSYIEADILDSTKQATAFSLIKTMVRKNIEHERMSYIIQTLAEMSITASQDHVRTQCRDTVCDYIENHPQTDNVKKWLEFFTAQLEYEYEDGRMSAAEALHKLFSNLLPDVLDKHSFLCLLKLASRLVNEEGMKCRKYVVMTIRKLLESISYSSIENIATAGCDWLESNSESSKAVGAEILMQISLVEKAAFCNRLPRILTAFSTLLSAESYLEENSEHMLISLFDSLVAMLKNSGTEANKLVESPLAYIILSRLESAAKCNESILLCQSVSGVIGQFLSMWTSPPDVSLGGPSVPQLVDWMCWQLRHRYLKDDMAEQCSKNIVFLSQWLSVDEFEDMIKRLVSIIKFEIIKNPKDAVKRMSCFKLAAAFIVKDKGAKFDIVIREFLPYLVREMNKKSTMFTDELYNIATEIGELIRTQMGEQEYSKKIASCQKELLNKLNIRKRKQKELTVVAPQEAAELKRKKNVKKAEAKKRKLDEVKPHRITKRKLLEKKRLQQDLED